MGEDRCGTVATLEPFHASVAVKPGNRRSSPTSRVSRRVDAGASNPSATNQVRPAHLDLKSIAKCKAHIGEALVCDPRLTPYDSCLHSPPSNDT